MIIRFYPPTASYIFGDYEFYDFDEFEKLKKDEEFLKKFNLFEQNIDYRTGEKIIPKSNLWEELKKEFIITLPCDSKFNIYFGDIISYENGEYYRIDGRITTIKNYNKEANIIGTYIAELKYWEDYVMFDGDKYGIPTIFNSIHREDNCFGKFIYVGEHVSGGFVYSCDKCFKEFILFSKHNISP